jgi:hypothetical protein
VTRFQNRKEPVIYEIAQVKIIVENTGPDESLAGKGIIVYAEDRARPPQLAKKHPLKLIRTEKSNIT